MNLILWRHAEAEDIAPDGRDASRRLTEHGRKQAHVVAGWLNRHLPENTRILASPAERTRQTAAALARPFDLDARLSTDSDASGYLAASNWGGNGLTILLVGHQPTLGEFAATLMCGQPLPWSVKKGAVWWLRFEGSDLPARLVCMFDPKHLKNT